MVAGRVQLMHWDTYPASNSMERTVHCYTLIILITDFGGGDWICRRVGVGEDGVATRCLYLVWGSVSHPVVTLRSIVK